MKQLIISGLLLLTVDIALADTISTISPNVMVTSPTTATAEQTSTATNSGVSGNNNTTFTSPAAITQRIEYSGTQTIKNTPSVNGPMLTTSNDTCMGSTSGSLNIAGLGFGGGSTWVDTNCKRLKNSRELWNMGMQAASIALMCNDRENKEALEITGFICPQSVRDKAVQTVTFNPLHN